VTDKISLDELLRADPADPGCEAGIEIIDEYVELELAGRDAAAQFPGLAAHLRCCPACRLDHDGILDAARAEL
jgi:hypothetical protein